VNAKNAWEVAYSQLELQFDRASFNTWLRGTSFLSVEGDTFIIGVRNSYAQDMLQHRLYASVRRVLSDVYGRTVELRFEVHSLTARDNRPEKEMPLFRLLAEQPDEVISAPLHEKISQPKPTPLPENELNPRFTFERFIVNSSNRLTYEAARAVADSTTRTYNPLLVYGGVGLGKTHLLQAIGHVFQSKGLRAVYIPSEVFTNDLIAAIRSKTTAMFRDKYRSVDALLVDDIQFIAGKDSTQVEFFHTFNALYTFNKQIVLASDRPPRDLDHLEARLRSRFEGGLVTDVKPLEFESRLALLEMWAQERHVQLPGNALHMIAGRETSNVRELEGMFNQVIAKARLFTTDYLTPDDVAVTLKKFDQPRQHGRKLVTIQQIIAATADNFQLSPHELTGKRRTGRINQARQVAMYLSRELTDASLPQIGEVFGKRSHTTVLHGCNKIVESMEFDSGLIQRVDQIRRQLLATPEASK
jgi:chromosomal replication initiator protein